MSVFVRLRHLPSAVIITLVVAAFACDGGSEGDRCNPDLSHNDCNGALTCQQPATCVENYCCPTPASASTNPFCNGTACPQVDAGSADASTTDGREVPDAGVDASGIADARGDAGSSGD